MSNTSNKDILLFSDEYPPHGGGAGVVARQLAKGLRGIGRATDLLVGATKNVHVVEPDMFTCYRFTLIWPLLYALKLIRLRAWRYQYFILNDNVSAYIGGLFFSRAMLRRSVVLVHGDDSKYFLLKKSFRHLLFGYAGRYRRTLKYCMKAVAASEYARDNFLEYADHYIDKKNVSFAYMGIDADDFDVLACDQDAIIIPKDSLLLFSASRLTEEKGLLEMLDLFSQAKKNIPNLHWHIAGNGPLQDKLKARISSLGLQDCVKLLGRLPRPQLANYYINSDVFWLLSKYETFGLVYIEAAWFGCPSIALRVAGIPEAIDEGVSGNFYDGSSDIANLIQLTALLDRNFCKQHAKKFCSNNFAKNLHQILNLSA